MSSTVLLSDTDIQQAKLLSSLSHRPAKVHGDIFVWNGHLVDRATAVVALLKVTNKIPVHNGIKMHMHWKYCQRFKSYGEELVDIFDDQPDVSARQWFNAVCKIVKQTSDELPKETVKQILIDLHKN